MIEAVTEFFKNTADHITAVAVSSLAMFGSIAWIVNGILNYKTFRTQKERTRFAKESRDAILRVENLLKGKQE